MSQNDNRSRLKRVMNRTYYGYLGVEWALLVITVLWFGVPIAVLAWVVLADPGIETIQSVTLLILAIVVFVNSWRST